MTLQEFDATSWGSKMFAAYHGHIYRIASVDFEERLIGLLHEDRNEQTILWVRCENATLVEPMGGS